MSCAIEELRHGASPPDVIMATFTCFPTNEYFCGEADIVRDFFGEQRGGRRGGEGFFVAFQRAASVERRVCFLLLVLLWLFLFGWCEGADLLAAQLLLEANRCFPLSTGMRLGIAAQPTPD
jgi:hypothetical protein